MNPVERAFDNLARAITVRANEYRAPSRDSWRWQEHNFGRSHFAWSSAGFMGYVARTDHGSWYAVYGAVAECPGKGELEHVFVATKEEAMDALVCAYDAPDALRAKAGR